MDLRDHILDVPDYPKPGIVFKDITPLLGQADALGVAIERMAAAFRGERIDVVVGMESRGFLLGAPLAMALGAGFVPARKAGKLPRETRSKTYALEYGEATLEMHADAFGHGARVLICDDVLATGGTAAATISLCHALGGEVAGLTFLLELEYLNGRAALGEHTVVSLVRYSS